MPQIIRRPDIVDAIGKPQLQVAHGFVVGQQIYVDGAGVWQLAQADDRDTLKEAMVSRVIDADNFVAISYGGFTWPAHGLVVGDTYVLDDAVAGGVTNVYPTAETSFIQGAFEVVRDDRVKVIDQAVLSNSASPAVNRVLVTATRDIVPTELYYVEDTGADVQLNLPGEWPIGSGDVSDGVWFDVQWSNIAGAQRLRINGSGRNVLIEDSEVSAAIATLEQPDRNGREIHIVYDGTVWRVKVTGGGSDDANNIITQDESPNLGVVGGQWYRIAGPFTPTSTADFQLHSLATGGRQQVIKGTWGAQFSSGNITLQEKEGGTNWSELRLRQVNSPFGMWLEARADSTDTVEEMHGTIVYCQQGNQSPEFVVLEAPTAGTDLAQVSTEPPVPPVEIPSVAVIISAYRFSTPVAVGANGGQLPWNTNGNTFAQSQNTANVLLIDNDEVEALVFGLMVTTFTGRNTDGRRMQCRFTGVNGQETNTNAPANSYSTIIDSERLAPGERAWFANPGTGDSQWNHWTVKFEFYPS